MKKITINAHITGCTSFWRRAANIIIGYKTNPDAIPSAIE